MGKQCKEETKLLWGADIGGCCRQVGKRFRRCWPGQRKQAPSGKCMVVRELSCQADISGCVVPWSGAEGQPVCTEGEGRHSAGGGDWRQGRALFDMETRTRNFDPVGSLQA